MAVVAKRPHDVGHAGPRAVGIAPHIDYVGPVARQRPRLRENLLQRQTWAVVDLGNDLDVVSAVIGRSRFAAKIIGQPAQIARPALDGHAGHLFDGCQIAFTVPGQ
jgi:hypothetical protein